jgi:tetratricopeptide (TPR) repeat protein
VSGDEKLVTALAERSDVKSIRKERTYHLDRIEQNSVTDAAADADPAAAEWGVKDIKADQVWSQYDDRGEGIVIANVDSGVQYDHPALVGNYRGNLGDGTFRHDYNWYDPTGQCAGGVPCDNNGHGTHTMGTMVGAGGVGVAPGATWIAAKGCESSSCSDSSLLAAGQWILAPTDHNGQNPKPEMAPDIVNNSWGGGDTTFYQDIVEAWNAAGIFEAFAAGNDGDGTTCSTTHAPGSQAPSYGVGAYDVNGRIAGFSGFGPSLVDGSAKPNISAPGVKVASGHRALRLAEHTGDPTAVAFERANLAELHLLLREFREAREHAEAAVRETGGQAAWCTPYALAALARVRIGTGEPDAAELLTRAGEVAEAQGDLQAVHEVRAAQAELLVREGRPQEAHALLTDGSGPGSAALLSWAELLSGQPEQAARLAAAEIVRAEEVGERLSLTEARTVHAAALAALGREREAREEFDRAAVLADELPYPAGAFAVDQARGTDWTTG